MKTLFNVDNKTWVKIKDYATVEKLSVNSAVEWLLKNALRKLGYDISIMIYQLHIKYNDCSYSNKENHETIVQIICTCQNKLETLEKSIHPLTYEEAAALDTITDKIGAGAPNADTLIGEGV